MKLHGDDDNGVVVIVLKFWDDAFLYGMNMHFPDFCLISSVSSRADSKLLLKQLPSLVW